MFSAKFFRNLWKKLKARKQSRERVRRPFMRLAEQLEERIVLSGTPNGSDDGLLAGAQTPTALVGTRSTNLPPANTTPVGSPVNERQRWSFTGEDPSRTVDFTFNGVTKTYRHYTDFATFLNDLAGPGNIVIAATGIRTVDLEFRGIYAQQDVPQIVTSNPTTGSTSTITTIRQGVAPSLVATQETPQALSGFSISDVDAGSAAIQVALSVTHGTLSLSTSVVNGITAGQLSGNGTGVVTVTAPVAAINATLAATSGLSYLGESGFYGTDYLTLVSNDLGNTGTGGALSDTDTVAIRVNSLIAPNVAPVNNLPAVGAPVNEIQRWSFTGEDPSRTVDFTFNGVTKTYRHYTDFATFLNDLAGPGNIVIAATGIRTVDLEFRGIYAQQDVPQIVTSNPTTGSTSTITTIRQGVAPNLTATQETPQALSGFSISDVDAGSAAIQVALSVTHGTLSLSTSVVNGITAGQLSGNGTGVVTVTAPVAAINATLAATSGLSYLGASGFYGTDYLTIVSNDLGNTGIGGALVDTDTVAIRVNSLIAPNVAPVNNLPAVGAPVNEIQRWSFTGEDPSRTVDFTFNGVTKTYRHYTDFATFLNDLAGPGNIVIAATGIRTVDLEFRGIYAQQDVPQIVTSNPTTGSTSTITTLRQGVAPNLVATQETPQALSGFSISDVDAGSAAIQVALSVTHGTLSLSTTVVNGITAGQLSGNGTGVVTVTAPVAAINATLAATSGLSYLGASGFYGTDYLTIVSNDLGNTGIGGALVDTDTVAIRVNSLIAPNVAPVNNLPAVGSPVNEIQRWSFTGEDPSRTVDFTFNGVTKTYRHYTDFATFLNDLAGPGNIVIAATGIRTVDLEFRGIYAQQDVPQIVTSNPTTGSTSTITTIRQGVAPNLTATQETPKALSGFSISDVDAGSAAIQVALSVTHGTLSLSTSVVNGITAGQLSGNGTGVVTVTAPVAAINATLAATSGLSYLGASGFYGTDYLTIVSNDLGNTGIGGALVDTDTVTIRVSNANALVVDGTSGNDEVVISFPSQSTFQVSVNGVSNSYSISQYADFVFNGLGGRDKLTALLRSTADLATISGSAGSVQATDFVFSFSECEELVLLGDAADRFVYNDPGVANTAYLLPQYAIVQSAGLTAHAVSFGFYTANATGNDDTLFIYGDSNSQSYVATPTQARMPVGSQLLVGNDFKRVYAYGMGGNDTATYSGSSADETMTALSTSTFVNTASTVQYFDSFKKLTVNGNGGLDIAVMYDSSGIDTFTGSDNSFQFLRSGVFNNIANGYDKVYAFSLFGGFDTATLNGSNGDDRLTSIANYSALVTPATLQQATGFRTVIVNAGAGNDIATLYDSPGNDTLNAFAGTAEFVYANGRTARAIGFDTVNANGTLGGTNRRNLTSPAYQLKFKGTWV